LSPSAGDHDFQKHPRGEYANRSRQHGGYSFIESIAFHSHRNFLNGFRISISRGCEFRHTGIPHERIRTGDSKTFFASEQLNCGTVGVCYTTHHRAWYIETTIWPETNFISIVIAVAVATALVILVAILLNFPSSVHVHGFVFDFPSQRVTRSRSNGPGKTTTCIAKQSWD
jgi:hypothetical protein